MMTKVLHVNQQHKLHGVDDDKGTSLHGVDDDKGTSCKSTKVAWCRMTKVLHVNQQHKLHGVDDDKGTSCKSTAQVAWCR